MSNVLFIGSNSLVQQNMGCDPENETLAASGDKTKKCDTHACACHDQTEHLSSLCARMTVKIS